MSSALGYCPGCSLSRAASTNSPSVATEWPPSVRARSATSSTKSSIASYCSPKNLCRSLNWGPTTFQ